MKLRQQQDRGGEGGGYRRRSVCSEPQQAGHPELAEEHVHHARVYASPAVTLETPVLLISSGGANTWLTLTQAPSGSVRPDLPLQSAASRAAGPRADSA